VELTDGVRYVVEIKNTLPYIASRKNRSITAALASSITRSRGRPCPRLLLLLNRLWAMMNFPQRGLRRMANYRKIQSAPYTPRQVISH
jgi:hypothetical protein